MRRTCSGDALKKTKMHTIHLRYPLQLKKKKYRLWSIIYSSYKLFVVTSSHTACFGMNNRCRCIRVDLYTDHILIPALNGAIIRRELTLCFTCNIIFFLFHFEGAACNKVPGFSQFHFMVSNPESDTPLLKSVDCS